MNEQERARTRDHVARETIRRQDQRRKAAETDTLARRREFALTPKQLEAAQLWTAGYTIREIADQLGVATNAVRARILGARVKLGVVSSHQAARRDLQTRIGAG